MSPLLQRFEQGLGSLIRFAQVKPWWVISSFLLLCLGFSWGARTLTQIVSIEDQLDPELQSTKDLKLSKELFGGHSSFGFLVLAPSTGFTAGQLCQLKRVIDVLEKRYPEITGSMSVFDLRRAEFTGEKLHYMSLLPNVCLLPSSNKISLEFLRETPWAHLLSGKELRDLAVNFSLAPLDPPGTYGSFNPEIVKKLLAETEAMIDLDIRHTGTSAQEYFTMIGMVKAQWINILAVVLIVFVFRLIFGMWRGGPLYFLTVGLSATVIYGGMGWFQHPVDPLSVCLFLMLSVASLEDYIFVSYEIMQSPDRWREAFARVAVPCFFTSLSAAAAFLSLSLSSELITIKRFGAWASVGAMMEWMAVFLLLPALFSAFPKLGPWVDPKRARFKEEPTKLIEKTPHRLFSFLALSFFAAAFYGVQNFKLSQTPSEMFPKDHPFQATLDFIRDDRGWVADAGLIFNSEASIAFKSQVRTIVQQDPLINTVETWEQIIDFVAPEKSSPLLRAMVEREMSVTGLSERYVAAGGETRDVLYLKTTNTAEVNRFREKVEKLCPQRECYLAGEFIGFADFSRGLIHTLFESMLGSIFSVGLIVFCLGLATGHIRQAPVLVLASFWGPAVMLTMIYLCDISINFVTCIVASTLIGLTGDNAIMFMFQGHDITEGIEEKGVGSFQTAVVMALCSLTFVFSYFEPPRMLGILLAGGFICALIGDVWILKGLLPKKVNSKP